MAIFPSAVATDSNLYIAVNQKSTTITDNPLTAGATTVNVLDASAFPSVGAITVDAEIISYTGKTGTSFTGCTRGFDGTSAASHVLSTPAYHRIIANHHNVLKDEIKAIEQNISDRLGLSATQSILPVGSAAAPSLVFSGDLDSGLFLVGANTISIVTGATERLRIQSDGFLAIMTANSGIYFGDGTVTSPVIAFNNEATSGLYRIGAQSVGFAINSTLKWKTTVDGLVAVAPLSVGSPGSVGYLDIYPATASRGKVRIDVANATGNTVTEIFVDVQAAARLYTIPDAGASSANFVMSEGAATINGTKTFAGQLIGKGTTTNDNAAAGYIGEYISSVVSTLTNFPTSSQFGDLTSISLTAGDWDVSAVLAGDNSGATASQYAVGISSTSGNSSFGLVEGSNLLYNIAATAAANVGTSIASFRVSLSSTTTYYLKYRSDYSAGTPRAQGRISARRVR